MRFMMLLRSGAGDPVAVEDLIAKTAGYNDALVKSGVLLATDRFAPGAGAIRVSATRGRQSVTAGAEVRIAGFWIIQVATTEEAIEWAGRCPTEVVGVRSEVELLRIFETAELPRVGRVQRPAETKSKER